MINAQSFFIPLFFDEAETDLWFALQRIAPEERSSFIKAILRQVLLTEDAENRELNSRLNSKLNSKLNCELNDEEILADLPEDELESTASFSLEALFEVNVSDQDTEQTFVFDLESLRAVEPVRPAGFEYLMKHIIGTEEDEGVLEVLRGFASTSQKV
jgi:hypothetical protein